MKPIQSIFVEYPEETRLRSIYREELEEKAKGFPQFVEEFYFWKTFEETTQSGFFTVPWSDHFNGRPNFLIHSLQVLQLFAKPFFWAQLALVDCHWGYRSFELLRFYQSLVFRSTLNHSRFLEEYWGFGGERESGVTILGAQVPNNQRSRRLYLVGESSVFLLNAIYSLGLIGILEGGIWLRVWLSERGAQKRLHERVECSGGLFLHPHAGLVLVRHVTDVLKDLLQFNLTFSLLQQIQNLDFSGAVPVLSVFVMLFWLAGWVYESVRLGRLLFRFQPERQEHLKIMMHHHFPLLFDLEIHPEVQLFHVPATKPYKIETRAQRITVCFHLLSDLKKLLIGAVVVLLYAEPLAQICLLVVLNLAAFIAAVVLQPYLLGK